MSKKRPVLELPEFRRRLIGGAHRSVITERSEDRTRRDDQELSSWPDPGVFSIVPDVHVDPWKLGDQPGPLIKNLADSLADRPDLLDAVVCSPHKVLDRALEILGGQSPAGRARVDAWIVMCWASEASWLAVSIPDSGAAHLSSADAEVLRPLAARLRFIVLSEPMRWRGRRDGTWWDWAPDQNLGGSGVFMRALGDRSWQRLADQCRQARADWMTCLSEYQDHRLLSTARAADLEADLSLLLFRDGQRRRLSLSSHPLAKPACLTAGDKTVAEDLIEHHLLPRFVIGTVTRLALADDHAGWRTARMAFAIAVGGAGLAAVGCAAGLLIHWAAWLTLACYALICAGIAVLPSGWGAMWLLRMPAASVVGVITLVTFMPGSWLDPPPQGWHGAGGWDAVSVLTGSSLGYLLIQARNHGVARAAAWWRSLTVLAIGIVHALMISLIGLSLVAPAFVQRGWNLRQIWASPSYGQTGMVLALATAWCLAFGVFSQILWDDRPITAALAHVSWRRGR